MELTAPGRGLRSKTALKLLLNSLDALNIPDKQEMQIEIMQLAIIWFNELDTTCPFWAFAGKGLFIFIDSAIDN